MARALGLRAVARWQRDGRKHPDDWVLPATMGGTPATDEGTAELPIGMLAIVIGAVVLVGASVLAFRHEGA